MKLRPVVALFAVRIDDIAEVVQKAHSLGSVKLRRELGRDPSLRARGAVAAAVAQSVEAEHPRGGNRVGRVGAENIRELEPVRRRSNGRRQRDEPVVGGQRPPSADELGCRW